MNRDHLISLLRAHIPFDENEVNMHQAMCDFVEGDFNCFARSNFAGHITGSAWIVDAGREHVLLLHHGKLNRWLQPGGHVETDRDVLQSALREAREECGLHSLRPVSETIFDVDIHWIPAHGNEPRHPHYDVRFLLQAERDEDLCCSSESKELAWVALAQVADFNADASIMRMVTKTAKELQAPISAQ